MRFVDESEHLEFLESRGVAPCGDDRRLLCFPDPDAVLGFDFTNLTDPFAVRRAMEGDERGVERRMVAEALGLLTSLGLLPLRLYLTDDEWVSEEPEEVDELTDRERRMLGWISEHDAGMMVLEVEEEEELPAAVDLIVPQATLFSATIAVTDADARVLLIFSQEEEVSFNTTDESLYRKALKLLDDRQRDWPFDVIRLE